MAIKLNTSKQVIPMIYAYSTPGVPAHNGWTKIGYTEAQDVETRIKQQGQTIDVAPKLEWKGSAIFDDGTGDRFTDKHFHAYLRKLGIENTKRTEWFHVDGPSGRTHFYNFRADRGVLSNLDVIPYTLRKEQEEAVLQTVDCYIGHKNSAFLWNAKPRFGKTLTVYDFCKTVDAQNVLIVTNRPAIANSWYSDYAQFMGDESGFKFVSETESLKGQPYVLSRKEYVTYVMTCGGKPLGCIEFLSLQDLKGSIYFGGKFDKLREIKDTEWDILVIDEAHEGVDTLKTDTAFDHIKRKFTLHLSGTPFKALANDKFPEQAIFNWTYADEQAAKRAWDDGEGENPYENLPCLNLFTYQMSEIVRDEMDRGIDIDGETAEYAFDLNEFFATSNGKFIHEASVDRFLNAMTTQGKFPFSTEELRNELKHTFWLLNRVESAKALARKLREHPVFSQYEIVLAAGDGRLDDDEETKKSFDKVREAIAAHDKTITLSVGQLTTGITIPEWTAVLMLSNVKSPALYMQAAFRAQNPCIFYDGSKYFRKENAYVFDFDPARTLTIFEEFANDLSATTANGKGDMDTRKKNVRELLNFFPVIGEDEEGEMVALDAEKVLSIPRKIRSQEVVRRGFMSNFLFQNISGIFAAPQEVIDIISKFTPVDEPKAKAIPVDTQTGTNLNINPETGEVEIPAEQIVGTATEIFGEKIYGIIEDGSLQTQIEEAITNNASTPDETRSAFNEFAQKFKEETVKGIVDIAKDKYQSEMKASDAKAIEKKLNSKFDNRAERVFNDYQIEQRTAESSRLEALRDRQNSGKTEEEINAEYAEKQEELRRALQNKLSEAVQEFIDESCKEVVETTERKIKEREKSSIEDSIRDHLRGFSRTIPSFLMAYGNDGVTLSTFDEIVPNPVFLEVTSISLDQFRFLRDGGKYRDAETGEEREFAGNLFDPVVFDDSVKEFLRLKKLLADYFDEKSIEDIFDYIPPQKTNQIFTPKMIVKQMVDMLEEENPGCFDDPGKTFIDLYMKSGLYITEIVKRLYQSERMKAEFPNPKERLQHIFEKQVYGLAPTEIIYRIALAYILGFNETKDIPKHNFVQLDALPYAKEGTLKQKLAEIFGE